MKIFNQGRWNILNKYEKVAVVCRYCALPYFSNIVLQTRLSKTDVHIALNHLSDLGYFKEENKWIKTANGWALSYKYDNDCTNDYIDMIIRELLT